MSQAQRTWGILLVGGLNWDARGLDSVLPRPLLPFGDAPLISHLLRWLRGAGVCEATLCGNGHTRSLRGLLGGESSGVSLHYYEDRIPRGPAGCARDAGERAEGDTLLLCEGSILPRFAAGELLRAHHAGGAALTVVAHREDERDEVPGAPRDEAQRPGRGEDRLVPTGVYVLARRALRHVPATGYQDVKEMLVPALHRAGERIDVFVPENLSPRITDAESYLALHEWMLEELAESAAVSGSYRRHGSAWLHPTADVQRARLIGPVLVGPQSTIADEATVIGPTAIGASCVVEAHAVVSRSVLWDGGRVGRWAVLDRCTLTHGASVAEYTQLHGRVHLPDAKSGALLARLLGLRPDSGTGERGGRPVSRRVAQQRAAARSMLRAARRAHAGRARRG